MSLFWNSGRSAEDQSDSQLKEKDSLLIPQSCGICFMPITRNTKAILQPCFHCFHFDCIDRWLSVRRYCAYCRATEPHVRHNFTSSLDFSTKFYDDGDDSLDLEDEDLEVLDYWGEDRRGRKALMRRGLRAAQLLSRGSSRHIRIIRCPGSCVPFASCLLPEPRTVFMRINDV